MVEATIQQAKDEQRDAIVAAASEVFSRYGYRKATLEQIGTAIGKVKSYVYYYFKSKEELFEAVVDREISMLRKEFDLVHASDISASQKLSVYTKKRMALVFQLANYYELISNGMVINPKLTEKLRSKYDQKEIEHIRIILEQGIKSGEFCLTDAELASVAYFTVLKGLEMPLFANDASISSVNERIEKLLGILFNGLLSK